jgi:hypothetical protein
LIIRLERYTAKDAHSVSFVQVTGVIALFVIRLSRVMRGACVT